MKNLFLPLVVFLSCIHVAFAADEVPGAFRTIMADGGGWTTGLYPHSDGRLYLRTDVGGVYRSDDGADSWQWISQDAAFWAQMYVQGLAVHPGNPDIVLATAGTRNKADAPGRGIWRSVNGGETWDLVLGADQVGDLNFSGNDIHRWGGPVMIFDPADTEHNTVWAGTRQSGLFRSTDGGDTWSQVGGNLFSESALIAVHKDADFPDHLWVGGGYHNIGGNPPVGEGGLWFSPDNGVSFTKVLDARMVYRVVRHPDTDVVYVASRNPSGAARLHRITASDWSNPGTFTFTDLTGNLGGGQDDIVLLTVLSDGSIVAGYQNQRTSRSFDGGDTWTALGMNADPAAEPPPWRKIGETQVAYGRNGLIEDPTDSDRWIMTTGFGVEVSTDEGENWTPATRGVSMVVAFKTKFHPTDPNLVYIPTGDLTGILIEDGGVSGEGKILRRHIPLWPNDAWNSINIDWGQGENPTWTVLGSYFNNNAQFTTSTDLGESWTSTAGGQALGGGRGLPNWSPVISSLHDGDEWLVALQQNVYRSTNGGENFTEVLSTGFSGDTFSGYDNLQRGPGDTRYFYRIFGGFYRSEDRGATWSDPISLQGTFGTVVADPENPATLYAILYAFWPVQNGQSLQRSTNGGDTWEVLGDFTALDTGGVSEYPRIDAVDGRLVVWAKRPGDEQRHVYYSDDGGDTWARITRDTMRIPDVNGLALDPHRPGTVWISTAGRTTTIFTPFDTPLQAWLYEHFGVTDPSGDAALDADPDGDGIPNLFEYAFGGDPTTPHTATLSSPLILEDNGESYFAIQAERNPNATDIVIGAEAATQLQPGDWEANEIELDAEGDTWIRFRDTAPIGQHPLRFLRITVSESFSPPPL